MRVNFIRRQIVSYIILSLFFFAACAPLMGPYSPTAYQNATSLKAETLALMSKATTSYTKHEQKVEALMVNIDKAYEYVHGFPSNDLSSKQWEILRRSDGNLLGKFFRRWEEDGSLNKEYIDEFKGIITDAFDEIICLEANKKEATTCLRRGGK